MSMETVSISLTDGLKRYVEQRVAIGDYGDVSEYVRELIRADREAQQRRSVAAFAMSGGVPAVDRDAWRLSVGLLGDDPGVDPVYEAGRRFRQAHHEP